MVMISFFVLKEVLVFENGTVPEPFHLRVIFQMVILTCLAVPTIMLYTAQEVRRIKREEFMMAATVLGGSKWHRVKNHVWPHVLPSFFYLLLNNL